MDWIKLYNRQRELDLFIQKNHQLENESLTDRKILAFQVELGELANETRCFKFWSHKTASSKEVILEEYVDGLHFLLSLGLEMDYRFNELEPGSICEDEIRQFLSVYHAVSQFEKERDEAAFHHLFQSFLSLGEKLGFTRAEVMESYLAKNEVNHQRQDEGY
ncbi:Dimeric dUTPase, all-alpha-NTP-PPase (MazG) superfamily [Tindallia magadiensis]|uniref:Dimeric dUTPase, all-alpha-NTP-PPase (MazG) superfamily n=1 Tax=Tindallia magadiensis TaxID=69895 RepID=A0A1I3DY97_9FIRM|nr:dUTP diphosphatase [Tindallia magadiensis]SFH91712.1 Dimeric dUTPase, all-alpha-NTP-PPase (MazG) superfamily [Tindallia magadiensis]